MRVSGTPYVVIFTSLPIWAGSLLPTRWGAALSPWIVLIVESMFVPDAEFLVSPYCVPSSILPISHFRGRSSVMGQRIPAWTNNHVALVWETLAI